MDRKNCRASRLVCLSEWWMPVVTSLDLQLCCECWTASLSFLYPPPSSVTGSTQEQLLLPLLVSTALHHSLSKPACVCTCAWGIVGLAHKLQKISTHWIAHILSEARKQVCMTWDARSKFLMVHTQKKTTRHLMPHIFVTGKWFKTTGRRFKTQSKNCLWQDSLPILLKISFKTSATSWQLYPSLFYTFYLLTSL